MGKSTCFHGANPKRWGELDPRDIGLLVEVSESNLVNSSEIAVLRESKIVQHFRLNLVNSLDQEKERKFAQRGETERSPQGHPETVLGWGLIC